jgi:hypothetical protein
MSELLLSHGENRGSSPLGSASDFKDLGKFPRASNPRDQKWTGNGRGSRSEIAKSNLAFKTTFKSDRSDP